MRAHLITAIAAALVATSANAAELATGPVQGAQAREASPEATLVLAAVDEDQGQVEQQPRATAPDATPAKPRRAARVTTCRCGEPRQN